MRKIVILGIGMAGHVVYKYLKSLNKDNIIGISRTKNEYTDYSVNIATELFELGFILDNVKPDVIINCIGTLVKESEDYPYKAIYINGFFPLWLEGRYKDTQTRVIHLSTDCVFDGKRGNYLETDLPTEKNWYGRTKAMGELNNVKDLTLRLSIIGPELKKDGVWTSKLYYPGLFNWFMGQTGTIKGYRGVLWNGITTLELAKQIDKILDINLIGIYHLITNEAIVKGDLIKLIQKIWDKKDVKIEDDSSLHSNKVLINSRLSEYDPHIPSYNTQLEELYNWYDK